MKRIYTHNLTVVIRDDTPFIHLQEPPGFRTVDIKLTPEQMALLELHENEDISKFILEPADR